MNKVILIGLVGADAEVRTFQNENKVMNFNLATSKSYKDKDGKKQDKTIWHKIQVWNKNIIEYNADRIKKGCMVLIEGEIVQDEYIDKETNKNVKVNKINANTLRVFNSKQTTNIESNDAEDIDDNMPF